MPGIDIRWCRHNLAVGVVEQHRHVVIQRLLIALQRQRVVAALIDDLLGDGPLAVQCIGGDDGALQRQHGEQLGHGCDLVRFVIRDDLGQHQPLLAAPGADHVQGRFLAGPIEGATQHLAVDGNNPLALFGKHRHEASECGGETLGVQHPE